MPDKLGIPTESEILALCYGFFQVQPTISDAPLGEGTFEGDLARALAGCLGSVLEVERGIYNDAIPTVVTDETGAQKTECSTAALDLWAYVLGLPSNTGAGKYGRNGAQPAKGGGGTASGIAATVIPTGSLLTDPSGQVVLQLRTGVTIPGSGLQPVTIDAVTNGAAGNLPAGTRLRWQSPPVGLSPEVVLTLPTVNGYDTESDLSLALRIVDVLQSPPEGGTAADYKRWSEAALDPDGRLIGILKAYVYPHREGTLTVTVVPTIGGSGPARDPGALKAAQLQNFLDSLRIVTDTVYVVRPWVNPAEDLEIHLRYQAAPGFQADWNYTSVLPTITSGSGTSIVINTSAPPPEMAAAIDTGRKPRWHTQLNGSAIPFQARALSYAVDTPGAGQCTITSDTALPVAPLGNTLLWPGGPAVIPIAQAVLAHIDSIGPSRESGYASEEWEDAVTVAGIAAATIGARDGSGNRVATTLPNTGNYLGPPVGVQIRVGVAGPLTTSDFKLFDNGTGNGPQIPACSAILMRPF